MRHLDVKVRRGENAGEIVLYNGWRSVTISEARVLDVAAELEEKGITPKRDDLMLMAWTDPKTFDGRVEAMRPGGTPR